MEHLHCGRLMRQKQLVNRHEESFCKLLLVSGYLQAVAWRTTLKLMHALSASTYTGWTHMHNSTCRWPSCTRPASVVQAGRPSAKGVCHLARCGGCRACARRGRLREAAANARQRFPVAFPGARHPGSFPASGRCRRRRLAGRPVG